MIKGKSVFYWGRNFEKKEKPFEKVTKIGTIAQLGKIKTISIGKSHILILNENGETFSYGNGF